MFTPKSWRYSVVLPHIYFFIKPALLVCGLIKVWGLLGMVCREILHRAYHWSSLLKQTSKPRYPFFIVGYSTSSLLSFYRISAIEERFFYLTFRAFYFRLLHYNKLYGNYVHHYISNSIRN